MLRRLTVVGAAIVSAVVVAGVLLARTTAPLPLTNLVDVPIEHKSSRFDYESIDPATGRLFIADLAGSRVLVFDTRIDRFVRVIEGVSHVHGVLAVPDRRMIYASATGNDQVVASDANTLAIVWRAPAGHYPDGMAWVPTPAKLYVSMNMATALE